MPKDPSDVHCDRRRSGDESVRDRHRTRAGDARPARRPARRRGAARRGQQAARIRGGGRRRHRRRGRGPGRPAPRRGREAADKVAADAEAAASWRRRASSVPALPTTRPRTCSGTPRRSAPASARRWWPLAAPRSRSSAPGPPHLLDHAEVGLRAAGVRASRTPSRPSPRCCSALEELRDRADGAGSKHAVPEPSRRRPTRPRGAGVDVDVDADGDAEAMVAEGGPPARRPDDPEARPLGWLFRASQA